MLTVNVLSFERSNPLPKFIVEVTERTPRYLEQGELGIDNLTGCRVIFGSVSNRTSCKYYPVKITKVEPEC